MIVVVSGSLASSGKQWRGGGLPRLLASSLSLMSDLSFFITLTITINVRFSPQVCSQTAAGRLQPAANQPGTQRDCTIGGRGPRIYVAANLECQLV